MKIVIRHKVRGSGVGALVVGATLPRFIELLSPESNSVSGLAGGGTGRTGLLGSEVEDGADADMPKENLFVFGSTLVYPVS